MKKLIYTLIIVSISVVNLLAQDPIVAGGVCVKGCPNYPCCLTNGDPCDDEKPCVTTGGNNSNDRPVIWLHGMEGSVDSWKRYYNDYVNKYKIKNIIPSYSSANGANAAATSVYSQISNQLTNSQLLKGPFVIAHSMGGLVTRTMDASGTSLFKGFVTVGTPHGGAPIAAAVAAGKHKQFINEGVTEVSKGPLAQVFWPSFANKNAKHVANFVEPKVIAKLEEFAKPGALGSLSPSGSTITTLNAMPPNDKPKLAFAGAETTPTMWRQIQSIIDAPSELAPDQEKDSDVPLIVDVLRSRYFDKYLENRTYALNALILPFKKLYRGRANAWLDGFIWLDQSNGKWQELIGAASGSITKTVKAVDIIHHGVCNNEVVLVDRKYNVVTNSPNDGVVLVSSALALPGANLAESLPGVNHQQCMNHKNVTGALTSKVFNGGGHPFFTCDPK